MIGEGIQCDECGKHEINDDYSPLFMPRGKDWQAEGWWFVSNPHNRVQHYCSSKCASNATWAQAVKDGARR